jgi:hypothetical protein
MESAKRNEGCYWIDFNYRNPKCRGCYFYVKCWKFHAKKEFKDRKIEERQILEMKKTN